MGDNTDIAARTQRFREAVRSFTRPPRKRYAKLMPIKDGIIELRDKGASLRLIRELLLSVDVSVSIGTIARFCAEMNGDPSSSHRVRRPRTHAAMSGKATTDRARISQLLPNRRAWHRLFRRRKLHSS
jgi:hypothetical protein